MIQNYTQRLLTRAQEKGLLRAKDLQALNIPYTYLGRMVKQGLLQWVGRGLYRLPHTSISQHHSLAEAWPGCHMG